MVGVRILSLTEIDRLNRDGAKLQPDKFYAQFFLINDQPNNAADPYPFQIAPEALDRVAKTAIGRPFILGATGSKHVRPADMPFDAKAIIEYQKKYAAGEIVHEYINPDTGNANVIVDIFPEYIEDLKNGKIPHYVSPLIKNNTADLKITDGRILVNDAEILHLQAVDSPGYGEVATIHGTCEGMLKECVRELRVLGASGMLKQFQNEILNNSLVTRKEIPDRLTTDSTTPPNAVPLTEEKLGQILDQRFTAWEEKHKTLGASGAVAAIEQVIPTVTTITPSKTEGEDAAQDNDIEKHPFVQKLKSEVDELKAAKEESDKKLMHQERNFLAQQIADAQQLSGARRKDKIKELVNSKDDLGSIFRFIQSHKGKILGASGGDNAELHTESAEPVGFELEDSFGGGRRY